MDSRRTIAAAAAGIAAAAAMVVLGGNGEPGVTPPVDRFMVDHAATTGQLPLNDPAAGIVVSTVHSR